MTDTLLSLDLLHTHIGFIMAGLIGFFFGTFLEKAGFGSSRKLTAIFYFRDMTMLKVMFTAVVTSLVGYYYAVALGWIDPANVNMLETFWGAQIIGGLIFGIGFVIGGWCPGTAFVGLASAKWDALVFLVGAGLGSILFNELYDVVRPLYDGSVGGHGGLLFLPGSLGIPPKVFPLIFSIAAVFAFAVSSWLEKKFAGASAEGSFGRRAAAALLVVLAAGIIFLGTPDEKDSDAGISYSSSGFIREIINAQDHIEAQELAQLMMAGTQGLTVVDIRPPSDYERFHLKGAVSIPLEMLDSNLYRLPHSGRIVLYSNGTTHAAQAWLELRHKGWSNVQVLTDGILGFWREALTPPSLREITDEQTSQRLFADFAKRKTYFLN